MMNENVAFFTPLSSQPPARVCFLFDLFGKPAIKKHWAGTFLSVLWLRLNASNTEDKSSPLVGELKAHMSCAPPTPQKRKVWGKNIQSYSVGRILRLSPPT